MRVVMVPSSAPKKSAVKALASALPLAAGLSAYVLTGLNPMNLAVAGIATALAGFLPTRHFYYKASDREMIESCLPRLASGGVDCLPGVLYLNELDGSVSFAATAPDAVNAPHPGVYHVDKLKGCFRVPTCLVQSGECSGIILAVFDPQKACSLSGSAKIELSPNDWVKAEFEPAGPGYVKVTMECKLSEATAARVYLSGYKLMECNKSGTHVQVFDFRGLDELVMLVLGPHSMVNVKDVYALFRTPLAGLCSGGIATIEIETPNAAYATDVRLNAATQSNPLTPCRVYE